MSRPLQLTSWNGELKRRFTHLPDTTVLVLALYSFGVILAHLSGLSTVALFLAQHLGLSYFPLRKRLSEFYKEAPAKSGFRHGSKRKDFDVTTCFAPLLRWVLSLWAGKHLPLAIDVTNLGDRFHVLCVSVVVNGVAIPVAWKVLVGGVKDPWNPHWRVLLEHLKRAVPDGWMVIVLSDRGLESSDLFNHIVSLGWHPLMRVKAGGNFQPLGWRRGRPMKDFARAVGRRWAGAGVAYPTSRKLACTLLACWEGGHDDAWLILTDLPAEAASPAWYAWRMWIEQGFKVIKSGCWQWQRTRMEDAERAARLWLVLAVATLWMVEVGGEEEELLEFAEMAVKDAEAEARTVEWLKERRERLVKAGIRLVVMALIKNQPVPTGGLFQQAPWPPRTWHSDDLTEDMMDQC